MVGATRPARTPRETGLYSSAAMRAPPIAAALLLAVCACGGPSGDDDDGQDRADAGLPCEDGDDGEAVDLLLGVESLEGDFDTLMAGDDLPVLLGSQGFYMLPLGIRAAMPLSVE